MGTNCVDNGRRGTLDKFLKAASTRPSEAMHYEFMQVSGAAEGKVWFGLSVISCTIHRVTSDLEPSL